MRDVLASVREWYAAGERFALATVIDTFRSAPRQPGATMAVSSAGVVVGSVSGGCVEADVYAVAEEVIRTGVPVVRRYGISDDDVFAIGLTCGGVLDVLVEPIDPASYLEFGAVAEAIESGRPMAVATVVTAGERQGLRLVIGQSISGSLGDPGLDRAVAEDALGMLSSGTTAIRSYGVHGECERSDVAVFVQALTPPPRMFVFGAIDFAAAVARVGKFLGYHVTVCDARAVFATRARFPEADEVVVDWPHRFLAGVLDTVDSRTALCVLTHDPKFDVPLLELALRTKAGYIGAMGSRRTHQDRMVRLRAAGLSEAELARLSSPIGLDLGARTPEETAISIAAEIIAARTAASARPLSTMTGRIHGTPAQKVLARRAAVGRPSGS
ncbi:XdhC family protein [Kribbella jejuensis]|uniref:Xanthine dehydrogenase accessory factor n=1 Tax=Kribbella jejuensis TaxID=236068 RepID=A0A542ES44_9ACTN|nr:XdhC/CoxI family protein [Kribbella jejuensis]TQJ18162.1 xanthine dehydrogenase accessory factor [Kribbella jejuensis]